MKSKSTEANAIPLALTVLLKDVAAHDAYQVDPIHLAFVASCKALWTRVQIYDAQAHLRETQ